MSNNLQIPGLIISTALALPLYAYLVVQRVRRPRPIPTVGFEGKPEDPKGRKEKTQ